MKTNLRIIAVFFLLIQTANAQTAKFRIEKKQKQEAHKIAFLSHRLNLNPEEAQKFWPVYNQYQNEMKALKLNSGKRKETGNAEKAELTENEIDHLIKKELEISQKKLDLRKNYYSKFKEVLPVKKVARLYKAENEFAKKSKELRKNRNENQSPIPKTEN